MENNYLISQEDLIDNPSKRVPICLCLDTSSSMLRIVSGEARKTGKTIVRDGKTWNVAQGGRTALKELQAGLDQFYKAILEDETAKYSAEICVVTFDSKVKLLSDYTTVDVKPEAPRLTADGETKMGEGVSLALDLLDERKKDYQKMGIDYYQPWLILMTDGESNGNECILQDAISRTVNLVNDRKLTIFPIGIGPSADLATLEKFSPNRQSLSLDGINFSEFFEWLSASVSIVTSTEAEDDIQLDNSVIRAWREM